MADGNNNSGGTSFLAFIVGGLLVAVVVVGLFVYGGHFGGAQAPSGGSLNVNVHAPTPSGGH